ncbi:MAG TPA: ABC transporter permease [Puia sp.]|nr:ABC transporter permease [Puia sp.]
MLSNYFKTAWRNLVRNKWFTLINISGLALGLVASLFILLWVRDELGMDSFHANSDRLYTLYEREYYDRKVTADYETCGLLPDELKRVIPEIQYATGMEEYHDRALLEADGKRLQWDGDAGSPDFFTMFSYPLLYGTPATALRYTDGIALSRKMATAFFGSAEMAMGKVLRYENKRNLTVMAVFEDLPAASSRKFDFVLNWDSFLKMHGMANWGAGGPYTVVLLRKDADPVLVSRKLRHFMDTYQTNRQAGYRQELDLQNYRDMYLYNRFTDGKISGGRIEYVRLFTGVAIFILLIACINFMNMATARSVRRAKEVGVRKVAGALRRTLIRQFMLESFLLTTIAVAIAVLLMSLLLPAFNQLAQKEIILPFRSLSSWLLLLLLTVVTSFIAGSYPALFLSSFNPVTVLKGLFRPGRGSHSFRRVLVVVQFTLSIILIIGTLVISRQVDFIRTKNIGYDRDNLVYIPMEGALGPKYDLFKEKAGKLPGIASVSFVSDDPAYMDQNTNEISWEGKAPDRSIYVTNEAVALDYVKTMRLTLVRGRDFSREFPTDTMGYLINQTAAKAMGFTDPIGKTITIEGYRKGPVIGVLKDFNFTPLYQSIKPLVLYTYFHPIGYGEILVRVTPGQTKPALDGLQSLCSQLNPQFLFSYRFSDEAYLALYKSEGVVRSLCDLFSVLAVVISCLGLLGLSLFSVEQRRKEISVRKILGARVLSLFLLIAREFLSLVGMAFLLAIPLAWLLMTGWLQNYAYRVDLAWSIFIFAGCIALGITLLTIGFQAIKVALSNPVEALHRE